MSGRAAAGAGAGGAHPSERFLRAFSAGLAECRKQVRAAMSSPGPASAGLAAVPGLMGGGVDWLAAGGLLLLLLLCVGDNGEGSGFGGGERRSSHAQHGGPASHLAHAYHP